MNMLQSIYQVYLKKACERVARGGGVVEVQNWWGEGHNVLSLFELTCFRLQTEIASDLKKWIFLSLYSLYSFFAF